MRFHAFRITDDVDDRGYFVLDRHVLVTLTLEKVSEIALSDFQLPGIIGDLSVSKLGEKFQLAWDSSYGVSGTIVAAKLRFNFEEWRPALAT